MSIGTDAAGNVVTAAPTSGSTFTVDNTAPTNQDTVFAASTSKVGGATVTIVSSGTATNNVWFAPSGTTSFGAGATMTTAGGTATSILAPATAGAYKLFVIDAAGNYSSASTATLTVDNTLPTISSVSSDKTNGNYTTGEIIDIDVTFSETVTSTGNITVTLETGTTDRTCTFTVSSATTGTCNYTVVAGDTSADLESTISGTITDAAGNVLTNFTPTTNLAANKALVIDTTAPSAPGTPDMTAGTDSGTSSTDDITSDTTPDFTISCESGATVTLYDNLTSVGTGACASSTVTITSSALSEATHATMNAKQTDVAGNVSVASSNLSVTIDPSLPTITSVSSDKADGTYTVGEVIDIDVTFSETVTSTGNVTVTLETGTTDQTCTFTVSSATTGTCNYTVQASDTSADLTASSISGTIADVAGNAMSSFTPSTNLAANKALIIDTTAPTIFITAPSDLATVSGASVSITANASDSVGVSGVQFKLDDAILGAEDTTSTYGITWDTTAVSEGSHTLKAVARDAAGNLATSTTITVTVDNIVVPTVTTSAASSIDQTIATLNGLIDSVGGENATEHGFAYGTASDLSTVIATSTLGAHSTGAFTENITGLTCNTTYYSRAYATNTAGTGYGSIVSFSTSACPVVSGGSSGSSRRVVVSPIVDPIINLPVVYPDPVTNPVSDIINNLIPPFLKPKVEVPPLPVAVVPQTVPLVLGGGWDLLSDSLINNFVLAPLPDDITDLIVKFPELARVFSDIGITKITDLEKLKDTNINLPIVANQENIPTDIVLAFGGSGQIAIGSTLAFTSNVEVEQKITALAGKMITLSVKPENPTESIQGYLLFKRSSGKTVMEMPTNSLAAATLLSNLDLAQISNEPPIIETELLVQSFEYIDKDKDGIYTASFTAPVVDGEYEVLTFINYKDKEKGSKELRMITVIDPEGYIYKLNNGEETRINNARISLFNATTNELWDAKKYNQENPQITDNTGKYSFLVPEGTYYLTATAKGYASYKGEVFEVRSGAGVHDNIEMREEYSWLKAFVDWKMLVIIIFGMALVVNFINDRRRGKIIK
jgi:hypothetical protein